MKKSIIATIVAGSMILTCATGCNVWNDLILGTEPPATQTEAPKETTESSEDTSDTTEASSSEITTEASSEATTTESSESSESSESTEASSDTTASESVESGVTRGSDVTEPSDTSDTSSASGYGDIYNPILKAAYDVLTKGSGDDIPEGFTGIMEHAMYSSHADAVKEVGYKIADLTGDGVPELVIGTGYNIFALYTIKDGKAQLAVEGWGRSTEQMLTDGSFYMSGSAGAAAHIFGRYTLSSDGVTKNWIDCYFTDVKDEQSWEIGIYHNKTGEMDKTKSEELNISMEDLNSIENGYMGKVADLGLQPLSFAVER